MVRYALLSLACVAAGLYAYRRAQVPVEETPQSIRLKLFKKAIDERNEEIRRRHALAAVDQEQAS